MLKLNNTMTQVQQSILKSKVPVMVVGGCGIWREIICLIIKYGVELYIGQLLYRVALQYLNAIENSASTLSKGGDQLIGSTNVFDSALTAVRTIVSSFWTANNHNDDDDNDKLTTTKVLPTIEDSERLRIATTMLEKAGMTYGNDDALFLLAEINFVI